MKCSVVWASKRIRLVLLAVVVLLLGIVGVALALFGREEPARTAIKMLAGSPDLHLKAIEHVATRNGKRQWSLRAESAKVDTKRHETLLEEVSVIFFGQDGVKVYVNADRGIIHTDTSNLDLEGNVRVHTDAYTLQSRRMEYRHGQRKIHALASVRLQGENLLFEGESLWYDLDKQSAEMHGNVQGLIDGNLEL